MSGPLPQEGEKYLVSPWCLCGKEHPCPDHGEFVDHLEPRMRLLESPPRERRTA